MVMPELASSGAASVWITPVMDDRSASPKDTSVNSGTVTGIALRASSFDRVRPTMTDPGFDCSDAETTA